MGFKLLFSFFILFVFMTISLTANDPETSDNQVDKNAVKNKKLSKSTTITSSSVVTTTVAPTTLSVANTSKNGTSNDMQGPWLYKKFQENKGMLLRTFYVLIGVTSIVIIYFAIRAWRLKRRRNKSRKYGLITSRGTDMEMAPLDDPDDDDDDDMTVFEHHKLRK